MNADASHTAVVILAAGASNRMGTPKQLLDWAENKTLLGHVIETVSAINPAELIVVLGAHFKIIENEIKDINITILENKNWMSGLGSSIACAADYLLRMKERHVLIALADQPFITAKYLSSMISEFQPNKQQIIASSYQNRPYGVPALFDASYLEELSKLSDDHGARFLLKRHEAFIKTLKPPRQNPDIDTPKDYQNHFNKN
ncbi:nucleotidyltransferase family protein [Gaetbulibacter aestuarii]|uniref:Nucleotidyltransferase family protein n=1 Tax=Gaetbulibacter aestuarii TaxID=1502358 RepID=A0ABW7N493_9FLAO